jgi:hypothetical protein
MCKQQVSHNIQCPYSKLLTNRVLIKLSFKTFDLQGQWYSVVKVKFQFRSMQHEDPTFYTEAVI